MEKKNSTSAMNNISQKIEQAIREIRQSGRQPQAIQVSPEVYNTHFAPLQEWSGLPVQVNPMMPSGEIFIIPKFDIQYTGAPIQWSEIGESYQIGQEISQKAMENLADNLRAKVDAEILNDLAGVSSGPHSLHQENLDRPLQHIKINEQYGVGILSGAGVAKARLNTTTPTADPTIYEKELLVRRFTLQEMVEAIFQKIGGMPTPDADTRLLEYIHEQERMFYTKNTSEGRMYVPNTKALKYGETFLDEMAETLKKIAGVKDAQPLLNNYPFDASIIIKTDMRSLDNEEANLSINAVNHILQTFKPEGLKLEVIYHHKEVLE